MKSALAMGLALFMLYGCGRQEPAQMTPQEQDAAKKAIGEAISQILAATNKLDVDALLQPYWSSPEFVLITAHGAMVDYQAAKNGTGELFKSLAALKYTTVKDDFKFLSGNTVLYTWIGKCECTFKSGDKANIDAYAVTYLFKKMDNAWKIVYVHESASPLTGEN